MSSMILKSEGLFRLKDKLFAVSEDEKSLTFYDPSLKKEKLTLDVPDNMEKDEFKKDLREYFKNYPSSPDLYSIVSYYDKTTGFTVYPEHYQGPEDKINSFIPESMQQFMDIANKSNGPLVETPNTSFDRQEEVITLKNKQFIVSETEDKLTFYNPDNKKEKLTLEMPNNMDKEVFKKDLTERLEKSSFTPVLSDIGSLYKEKTGIKADTERYYGPEKNINSFLPESIQQKMNGINKSGGPLVESPNAAFDRQIETAKKAGYVQGVCECVSIVGSIGNNYSLGKKMLSEMNVTKDMAKKYANPETYKNLEQGIFAQKQEQKLEQTHSIKR